jgi:hypothetical protein
MIKVNHTLAVAGHRKLPEARLPAIAQSIKAFLAEAKAAHGAVTVLSSCAEGADTLCAFLALELGLRLIVPLPMSAEEYRKDFPSHAAAEFDHLLSRADQVFTAPPEEPVPDDPPRGFFYRQAGIYAAKYGDALLAVWDGVEYNTLDGAGTWETIRLAKQFGKPVHYISV